MSIDITINATVTEAEVAEMLRQLSTSEKERIFSEFCFNCNQGNNECQCSAHDVIIEKMMAMSEQQRKDMFDEFCTHCGSTDTGCQCWNDE